MVDLNKKKLKVDLYFTNWEMLIVHKSLQQRAGKWQRMVWWHPAQYQFDWLEPRDRT